MKSILLADNRPELLATTEPILKHWGYRVLTATRTEQIATFLQESSPALLVIGQEMYARRDAFLDPETTARLNTGDLPLIVLKHPRHDLRLRLRLPGMYSLDDDEFLLADVLSLSMRGLFFKASARIKQGDRITVVFPLFGHCKELEVKSTVVYVVHPDPQNNFAQGFGVTFDDFPQDQHNNLRHYIKECFLKEVSSNTNGVGEFAENQLKS